MKHLVLFLSLFVTFAPLAFAESGDLHQKDRIEWHTTDLDASVNNIPTSPSGAAGSKLAVIKAGDGTSAVIGHTDHAIFCSTATTRIRVRFSDTAVTAPVNSAAYNFTVPAAASGSFVCATLDDVQLGQYIHIWSAGTAISAGVFEAYGW